MSKLSSLSGLAIAVIAVFVVVLLLSIPVSADKGPVQKGKGGGGKNKGSNPVMDAEFRDASTDGILSDSVEDPPDYSIGEMFGTGNFGLHLEETASPVRTLFMDFRNPVTASGGPDGLPPFMFASEDVFFRGNTVEWDRIETETCQDPTLPCIPEGASLPYSIAATWDGEDGNNYRLRFNDEPAGNVPGGGGKALITRTDLGTWVIEADSTDRARLTSTGPPKVRGRLTLRDYGLFKMPFLVTVTCETPPTSVGLPCQ